jgi:hypothetical protein
MALRVGIAATISGNGCRQMCTMAGWAPNGRHDKTVFGMKTAIHTQPIFNL